MDATQLYNVMGQGLITREDALELLNGPLSPNGLNRTIYDDREKLDWTPDQFEAWMKGEG